MIIKKPILMIGLTTKVTMCGEVHPSKLIFKKENGGLHIVIIKLPESLNWISGNCDPVTGGHENGASIDEVKKILSEISEDYEITILKQHENQDLFKGLNIKTMQYDSDDTISDQSYSEIIAIEKARGENNESA